jgi:adenylylsulfate kinase
MINWPYYEIYIKCSIEECAKRDPKGIYKKAHAGEITNMTGISAPYEKPEHPSLIIETDKFSLNQSVDKVIGFLLKKGLISCTQPKSDE